MRVSTDELARMMETNEWEMPRDVSAEVQKSWLLWLVEEYGYGLEKDLLMDTVAQFFPATITISTNIGMIDFLFERLCESLRLYSQDMVRKPF